jgi:hypothetical protein
MGSSWDWIISAKRSSMAALIAIESAKANMNPHIALWLSTNGAIEGFY